MSRRPHEAPEAPQPPAAAGPTTTQLVLVAALGLALGAGGTWLLLRGAAPPPRAPGAAAAGEATPGPSDTPEASDEPSPSGRPSPARAAAEPGSPLAPPSAPALAPTDGGPAGLEVGSGDLARSDGGAEAGPPADPRTRDASASDAAAPAQPLALVPGRVAYLRCPGAPPRPGPYPCPRSLPLERKLWRALAAGLLRCPEPLPEGRADVRFVFMARGQPPTAELDRRRTDLPAEALLGCLRPLLAPLRMPPPYRRLAVSLRFRLVPEPEAPEEALRAPGDR